MQLIGRADRQSIRQGEHDQLNFRRRRSGEPSVRSCTGASVAFALVVASGIRAHPADVGRVRFRHGLNKKLEDFVRSMSTTAPHDHKWAN